MTETDRDIASHYSTDQLYERILEGARAAGADPDNLIPDDLKAVDEFHTGGMEATEALFAQLRITPETRVLDIGSGIGGTARAITTRYVAHVTGVDLTPLFVETAMRLSAATGLADRTSFQVGSGTDLPVGDGGFDLALLMHVGMNVADKATLFREAHRALASGGTFAIFDVMRGTTPGSMSFPVPWSSVAETSFVVPPADYRSAAEAAGFALVSERDRTDFAKAFFDKVGKMIAEMGGPPPVGIHLLMGDTAPQKIENYLTMLHAGLIAPFEMIFRAAD